MFHVKHLSRGNFVSVAVLNYADRFHVKHLTRGKIDSAAELNWLDRFHVKHHFWFLS